MFVTNVEIMTASATMWIINQIHKKLFSGEKNEKA